MTTIAATRSEMAADSCLSGDDTLSRVRKIKRIGDKIVGVAGDFGECAIFMKWIEEGCKGKKPKMKNVQAVVLNESGIWFYEYTLKPYLIDADYFAIGTGSQAALAVLSPVIDGQASEAVLAAAAVDPFTDDNVVVIRL